MASAVTRDDVKTLNENGCLQKDHITLQISTSRKGLLTDEISPTDFPDNPISLATRLKMLKISPKDNHMLPQTDFQQLSEEKHVSKRSKRRLFKDINWPSISQMCIKWLRKPLNVILLLWIFGVVVSGAILFLVMTGMLNSALPKKSQRDLWFEVNNQIISALFTLMCLYIHPKRLHDLILLCRWNSDDVSHLRKVYSKNASFKPNERVHMMIVVILLQINCFAQYGLCGLNLGFRRSNRPAIGVGICLSIAIASPAIAGVYSTLSPLGKEYESEINEEGKERKFSFTTRDERVLPEWKGGLFSLWEDFRVAYLSLLCCFCVFGWNMERLGFGNMYVHIVTFLLFCSAPFWIFNLAAVNIENETIREILGISGIVLSLFGLLYGGFWRVRMRKRFNIRASDWCVSKPDVGDYVRWLFCCWCSLAQEVRTGDFYEIVEDGVYRDSSLMALPREDWVKSGLAEKKRASLVDETIIVPPIPATIGIRT